MSTDSCDSWFMTQQGFGTTRFKDDIAEVLQYRCVVWPIPYPIVRNIDSDTKGQRTRLKSHNNDSPISVAYAGDPMEFDSARRNGRGKN